MSPRAAKPPAGTAAPAAPDGAAPRMFLVVGADPFLVEEAAAGVLTGIDPSLGKGSFGFETVDGAAANAEEASAALERALAACAQTSFFAERQVVWLRGVTFCGTDRTSKSEDVKAALDSFRGRLADGAVPEGSFLLVSGAGIAKNSLLFNGFKAIEKKGLARIVDAGGGDSRSAKASVDAFLSKTGRKMSASVLEAFVSRVGNDAGTLRSECEKLFAYTGGKEPTEADVAEICSLAPGGVPWELPAAFGKRDLPGALAVLRKLLSDKGTSEIFLIRLLLTRLAEIGIAVDARAGGRLSPDGREWRADLPEEDAAAVRDLGALDIFAKPGFQKAPVLAAASAWTPAMVRRARLALVRGHERLVSSSSPASTVLEIALCDALS